MLIKGRKLRFVRRRKRQFRHIFRYRSRQVDSDELLRRRQEREPSPQVFTDFALYFCGMRREVGNRAVGINPLCGRHRAALCDAGHVIHFVAHQSEIVDDPFGPDTVLFLHLLAIENFSGHGVDKLNLVIHNLSQILVPRGNEDFPPGGFSSFCKGRQHVVGLHPLDLQ